MATLIKVLKVATSVSASCHLCVSLPLASPTADCDQKPEEKTHGNDPNDPDHA